MFSIFNHVIKSLRDKNSEPGLPVVSRESWDKQAKLAIKYRACMNY